MRRYVFNWGLARILRLSSENLPFSARDDNTREPIFAAIMAIWFIRLNQRPSGDYQNAASPKGLKVAEMGLSGAGKYMLHLIVREIACWLRTARASEGHLLDRDHVNF